MCDQEYKAGVVYLDNAATTRMAEEAEAAMQPYLVEKFGNASTAYGYGEEAQAANCPCERGDCSITGCQTVGNLFYIGRIGGGQLGS